MQPGSCWLTDEGEVGGEDEEHLVAVQGEREAEVSKHTGQHEELVHGRPVVGFQTHLGHHVQQFNEDILTKIPNLRYSDRVLAGHVTFGELTCMLTTTSTHVCARKAKD